MNSSQDLSRRHFLRTAAAVTIGFGALRTLDALAFTPAPGVGYGPLQADVKGILDLPQGFSYRVISRAGKVMNDGLIVPGAFDGMAAFPGTNGRTILVRNHELEPKNLAAGIPGPFGKNGELQSRLDATRIYNSGPNGTAQPGGTSTLVYNTQTGALESQFLSLAGTQRNCAGGPTPWNSWISCEETHSAANGESGKAHGYNFEVPARENVGLAAPVPLTAMGRFRHEAVAVEPQSGAVFQTEDRDDGLITRFLPLVKGDLARGGQLQALKIKNQPGFDTRNWSAQKWAVGQSLEVEWLDLSDVDSETDDLRLRGFAAGAARFARGEGMWFGAGGGQSAIYFACTTGGAKRKGQIWKLDPMKNVLTLWLEPNNGHIIENADNLTVAPWGDVYLSEDLASKSEEPFNWLLGVTPRGEVFRFARNVLNQSELAGVTFSPDGSTLFVNIYQPGLTLAIEGPWRSPRVSPTPRV